MRRETQRRLAVLAVVGVVAVAWVTAFDVSGVTPVATAAAVNPSAKVPRVARCPFPASLRHAFEVA
jgi:hypothetical protein